MKIDIKCLDCGRGTRNFELGRIFYDVKKPSKTFVIEKEIICPKCGENISAEKCMIKPKDFLMKLIAANIFPEEVPEHLQGTYPLNKKDYDLIKEKCKTKPKLVEKF